MIIHTRNDDGSIHVALKIFWSKNLHFINGPNFSQQILTFYVRLDISYQVHRFVFDTLVQVQVPVLGVAVCPPGWRYKRSYDLCPAQLSPELLSTMETVATVTSPAQPSPAQPAQPSPAG